MVFGAGGQVGCHLTEVASLLESEVTDARSVPRVARGWQTAP
jgi:hypothetical protein